MINIPFDHIKVLPDGSYGCTLKVGGQTYCAVFTPDWQVVEPLHTIAEDPYKDYTYIRDWRSLSVGSYYKSGTIQPVDKELLSLFDINPNVLSHDDLAIEIEDYILDASKWKEDDEEDTSVMLLFTANYLDKDGNIALTIENTLASYQMVSRAAIRSVFNRYTIHGCDAHYTREHLDLESRTESPIQKATIQLIEWMDFVKYHLDQLSDKEYMFDLQAKTPPYKNIFLSFVSFIFGKCFQAKMLGDGLFDFPRLIYLEYLKQSAPEICQ